ncbi:MAG: hypothetical protein AVDCRST_MAG75-266 [uncultured Propionibacteriaceae bacterium]|uniref:Uncharacterized protein n=1 Tax=uncultured Propionibacteriaceae bacterium TaxID=257457 RepID=A0A6J4N3G4_9ACTN|nr:MAG: hypothetical protein AVDCRST_MAG75-266 [uncultured Propionibacteriaceae bacterium]
MTVLTGPSVGTSVPAARAYAVLTWAYAAGFGVPAVPVSVYLLRRGSLPWFGDLFPMYGGPWSGRLTDDQFVGLLLSYLGLMALVAWAAGRVRHGSRRGAVVSAGLLPVEAVIWLGFDLPIPWVLGAARVALLVAAWRQLRGPQPTSPNSKEISHA